MTMRERLGKAACESQGRNWDKLPDSAKEWWLEQVDALLSELEKPDEGMIEAGMNLLAEENCHPAFFPEAFIAAIRSIRAKKGE